MKKIGIIFGMEHSFPNAVIDYINGKADGTFAAEHCKIDAISIEDTNDYNVILDRATQDVPFFRSYLKLATIYNTRIVNAPFRNNVGDLFFYTALFNKMGMNVLRTVVLPTKAHPPGTNSSAMTNIVFPISWDKVFDYVGFPSCLKPNSLDHNLTHYKVYNPEEFFSAYDTTGSNIFTLTQCIDYDEYFRCFVIGKKAVRIFHYDPSKPHHMRYERTEEEVEPKLKKLVEKNALEICEAINRDFNAIEFAIKDGVPYAVEFLNTSAQIEEAFMHPDDFKWLVETTGDYLISLTKEKKSRLEESTWGKLLDQKLNKKVKGSRTKAVKKS